MNMKKSLYFMIIAGLIAVSPTLKGYGPTMLDPKIMKIAAMATNRAARTALCGIITGAMTAGTAASVIGGAVGGTGLSLAITADRYLNGGKLTKIGGNFIATKVIPMAAGLSLLYAPGFIHTAIEQQQRAVWGMSLAELRGNGSDLAREIVANQSNRSFFS